MARPPKHELTERELEVMHVFWRLGPMTAADVRDALENDGRKLAYTTVATLIRILVEKGFLSQNNEQRPFRFTALRSFEDVSGSLVGDLIDRVFRGSRESMLMRMFDEKSFSTQEREILQSLLENKEDENDDA